VNGVILVDKPSGITSHDAVDHIRKAVGIRRVGHTGTLDPSATGLLILCLGAATRLSEFLTRLDKVYEGTLRLGVTTDSYDLDGEVLEENPVPQLGEADVQEAFNRFTGTIQQLPPMVSAVKVNGERLYKRARKGEIVEREPRSVTVHEFKVTQFALPDIRFRVRCSSGTYARALCHDVGQVLGCGGALAGLRRTMVGQHDIADAVPLATCVSPDTVAERLLPMGEALTMPEVIVRSAGRRMLATGSDLLREHLEGECPIEEGWIQVKTRSGELLALAQVQPSPWGKRLQPRKVFCAKP
jgi:tRNA pseudouridine55 synthase